MSQKSCCVWNHCSQSLATLWYENLHSVPEDLIVATLERTSVNNKGSAGDFDALSTILEKSTRRTVLTRVLRIPKPAINYVKKN